MQPMTAQEFKDAYKIVLGREPEKTAPIPDGRTAMQFIYDAQGELDDQRAATAKQIKDLQASGGNKPLSDYPVEQLLTAGFMKLK